MVMGMDIAYLPKFSRCTLSQPSVSTSAQLLSFMTLTGIVQYIAPAFVVATSCVISAVSLTRGNKLVHQRDQQQSRKRATVTILLFTLLYGVCKVPLVVDNILQTYCMITSTQTCYKRIYDFDTGFYYVTVMRTLLLATNSAANPILYLWRMPPLREYFLAGIRKIVGQNCGMIGPSNTVSAPVNEQFPISTQMQNLKSADRQSISTK